MKIKPLIILEHAADLLLPDLCAICGSSLASERTSLYESVPLCGDCTLKVVRSVVSNCFSGLRRCAKCGYPLISESMICGRCRERKWNFESAESLFFYSGIAKELISAYKFDNRKNIANLMADLFYEYIFPKYNDYTLVPVPFRPSSKRKRGWDQVEVFAKRLEKKYSIPVNKCLKRREGRPQKAMNYKQRLSNLENRISLKVGAVPPEKVLLLDDVFTTGATMDMCASVLSSGGSIEICCFSMALDL